MDNKARYRITESQQINSIFKTQIKIIHCPEYTSYYSPLYKYPLLVAENLKQAFRSPSIRLVRADIEDPFRIFEQLDNTEQLSVNDYQILKKYGFSPGHNAPAGHHKTSMKSWEDTFYHINMTPQEITFNAGIWLIIEQWCSYTVNHHAIQSMYVLTGSIPAKENTKLDDLRVNIPTFMYKIIIVIGKNGKMYQIAFMCPNKMIMPEGNAVEIDRYLITINDLSNKCGINLHMLINVFLMNIDKMRNVKTMKRSIHGKIKKPRLTMKQILNAQDGNMYVLSDLIGPIKFDIKSMLSKSLENGKWFGLIINSTSLDKLEENWLEYQRLNEEKKLNRTIEYHEEYYRLAKQRLFAINN